MSMPYQLVIFDWEGTISDTLGLVLQTVVTEAQALGFGWVDPSSARSYVDLGLEKALKKIFPNLSRPQQEELIQRVQSSLTAKHTQVFLMPGVLDLIKYLHTMGVDLAIATNKGQHSLVHALASSSLDQYFKVTRAGGQAPLKPSPQMLFEIMEVFGQEPANTLMIGDSTTDMEMAQRANVAAIGFDFYHQCESLLREAGAMEVFHDYARLTDFLKKSGEHA